MLINNCDYKKSGFSLLILFLLTLGFIIPVKAADNADAIAVRVVPNANHYSIDSWYKQQGYKGSPQKLLVDGYEAIRDGRTVFINAANVENKKVYTNIYLISYNQEPNTKTLDILGQLVSHWKFNNNLPETGLCSISKIACTATSDCPASFICSTGQTSESLNANIANIGKCILKNEKRCLDDIECPTNIFCDSSKAKLIRDVKRLGQLNDIKNALNTVGTETSRYPDLAGGTYVAGNTISTWPSWQESFLPKLTGLNQIIDPINSLGSCPGYEASTCWNKDKNEYYKNSGSELILPYGSYAYLYTATQNGISYNLCSTFETKELGYDTAEGQLKTDACLLSFGAGGVSANTPPVIKSSFTEGESGQEFNGYVKAVDNENDAISWKLEINPTLFSTWSALPVLRDSGDINQKSIYATSAGVAGSYPIVLVLKDSRGLEIRYNLILKITANKPIIEAGNIDYLVDPTIPLNYTFYVQSGNGIGSVAMTKKDTATLDVFGFPGFKETKTEMGANRLKIERTVLIPTTSKILADNKIIYKITAVDKKGVTSVKEITINLKIEKPYLNFDCDTSARINKPYPISGTACLIGALKEGNHTITYSVANSLGLNLNSSEGNIFLSGTPNTLTNSTGVPVSITATNEYGVTANKIFNLKVSTYCGDGIVNKPNGEGKGGVYNDGIENCDGVAGTTNRVASSSPSMQYGCKTNSTNTTYPILDNNFCVFETGKTGGGFCGDNLCQFEVNGVKIENVCNCAVDCGRAGGESQCSPLAMCGNGICDNKETSSICPSDCGVPPECLVDDDCSAGKYCHLDTSPFYYCNSGLTTPPEKNTCQKKCWSFTETDAVANFSEGDTLAASGCGVTKVDDPKCTSSSACANGCKSGGANGLANGNTGSGDSCWESAFIGKTWHTRNKFKCWNDISTIHYYGDACGLILGSTLKNGTVDANGQCSSVVVQPPCVPVCTGKVCGAEDTCGGKCNGAECAANTCGNGICESSEGAYGCYADCGGDACSDNSACSGYDNSYCTNMGFSGGNCENGYGYCNGCQNDQYNCDMCGSWVTQSTGKCVCF